MARGHKLERWLCRTGAARMVARRYGGRGVIFMLHSVVDDPESYLREPIRCTVRVLELLLRHLRARRIDIVSLDDALRRFSDPNAPRFAVLTFDDGYRDNLTRALPMLERYAAPATIYVTTCLIERTANAWWLGLVEWLKRREWIAVEGYGRRSTRTLPEKVGARIGLTRWVQADDARIAALAEAMAQDGVCCRSLLDQQMLQAEELRRLAAHPLITIGGHTTSHPWLAALPDSEALREITGNRSYLQDLTQQEVAHFAYPFGSALACAGREAALVAAGGFRTAATARHGCVFPGHDEERYALPREGVQWHDDEASLACKSIGARRFLRDLKFGRPWRAPMATMAAP
jgi:peptidoglycan/xylan/chitin deacetylase (PgdA/CDA1 family)